MVAQERWERRPTWKLSRLMRSLLSDQSGNELERYARDIQRALHTFVVSGLSCLL